jgi:hypothetical protein
VSEGDRLAAAVAGMHRPEIRMHPIDVGRMFEAFAPKTLDADRKSLDLPLVPLSGISIIADESVPLGQMRVVDAAPIVTALKNERLCRDCRARLAKYGALCAECVSGYDL